MSEAVYLLFSLILLLGMYIISIYVFEQFSSALYNIFTKIGYNWNIPDTFSYAETLLRGFIWVIILSAVISFMIEVWKRGGRKK